MVHEKDGVGWDVIDSLVDENDPVKLSARAKTLQACAGKRGCKFAKCVEAALGRVPFSVKKACPSLYPEVLPRRKA